MNPKLKQKNIKHNNNLKIKKIIQNKIYRIYLNLKILYLHLIKQIGKISYTPQPQLKNTVPNHKEIMVSYFIITVHFSTKQVWIK